MKSWLQGTHPARLARVADRLNERFVAFGRVIDVAARHGQKLVSVGTSRPRPATTAHTVRTTQRALAKRTRGRLSDLHMRVGESIYRLEAGGGVDETTARRQLSALLDEIERLEDVLRGFENDGDASAATSAIEELESLLTEDECQTERESKHVQVS